MSAESLLGSSVSPRQSPVISTAQRLHSFAMSIITVSGPRNLIAGGISEPKAAAPHCYVQSMAEMTNAFAEAEHPVPRGRAAAAAAAAAAGSGWSEATAEEIEALLGCLIYMGIVLLNATRDYRADETRQAFVANCFPRDRFMELLRRLRVSEGVVGEDERLEKLQQLIDLLEGRLRRYF